MKIYRWYSEALNMSGITAANDGTTKEDLMPEIECYIDNTFDEANSIADLMVSVWPIEEDEDFYNVCPTTIAISY